MPSDLLVTGGLVLDVAAGSYAEADVFVKDGEVVEVGPSLSVPSGTPRLGVDGGFVLPGLIDAHVHVTLATADLGALRRWPTSYTTLAAARLMGDMLRRGFTTVRDNGGADFGLAAAQAEGLVVGPRLLFCGRPISQTGGHGDPREKGEELLECRSLASSRVADGVDAVRAAARDELRRGAHHLKVMASGGVASTTDRVDSVQYSPPELRAVVEEAEAQNRYVAAHAYTAAAVNRALEAGVRSIEHGNLIDESSVALLVSSGAFLVPTLVTYWALQREGREHGLSASSFEKVADVLEGGLRAVELAAAAGVPLVFGSDLLGGMQRHQNEEFSILAEVQRPLEIIASATTTAAELLGLSGKAGVLAPGSFGDLVVTYSDPLEDVSVLASEAGIAHIVQAGMVLR